MRSPTQRSLKLLREQGWVVDIVERRVGPVTKDLFGIFDLVAVHPEEGYVLAVQTTTSSHFASRRKKMEGSPHLDTWLRTGSVAELHGWVKRGATWHCRRLHHIL